MRCWLGLITMFWKRGSSMGLIPHIMRFFQYIDVSAFPTNSYNLHRQFPASLVDPEPKVLVVTTDAERHSRFEGRLRAQNTKLMPSVARLRRNGLPGPSVSFVKIYSSESEGVSIFIERSIKFGCALRVSR